MIQSHFVTISRTIKTPFSFCDEASDPLCKIGVMRRHVLRMIVKGIGVYVSKTITDLSTLLPCFQLAFSDTNSSYSRNRWVNDPDLTSNQFIVHKPRSHTNMTEVDQTSSQIIPVIDVGGLITDQLSLCVWHFYISPLIIGTSWIPSQRAS